MLYQPGLHRYMWDTWMYYADGVHHLYYLYMDDPRSPGDGVAHARSTDGVHWEEAGVVIPKQSDADWLGSGAVWRAGDRYIMNFSELRDGRQSIFFAESTDLDTWSRLNEISKPDPRWYNDTPTGRWDCIYPLPRSDGGFDGYLTAIPWTIRDRPDGLDYPSIGRVVSEDGLRWSSAPPPVFDWRGVYPSAMTKLAEVAAIKEIEGRLYLLVVAWGSLGDFNGTYVFTGDDPGGPFVPSQPAFRLLTSRRHIMSNFLRFVGNSDDLLLHHTTVTRAGERWFPPLKVASLDSHKDLQVKYWNGNEALKGVPVDLAIGEASVMAYTGSEPALEVADGRITLRTDGRSIALFPTAAPGRAAVIEATLTVIPPVGGHGGAGFYIELEGDQACIVLAQTHGQTLFFDFAAHLGHVTDEVIPLQVSWFSERGDLSAALTPWWAGDDAIETGIICDVPHDIRMLIRSSMLELYIDDTLIDVYSLASEWTGRVGLVAETSTVRWSQVQAWAMSL